MLASLEQINMLGFNNKGTHVITYHALEYQSHDDVGPFNFMLVVLENDIRH